MAAAKKFPNEHIAHDIAVAYAVGTVLNGSKSTEEIAQIYNDIYEKILAQLQPKEQEKVKPTAPPRIPTTPSYWFR